MVRLPFLVISLCPLLSLAWVSVSPMTIVAARNINPHGLFAVQTATEEDLLLAIVKEGIAEQQGTREWTDCVEFLASDMGIPKAELLLASAFSWDRWAKAVGHTRKYISPQLPRLQNLQKALSWWREGPLAAMDPATFQTALEQNPQVILVDPATAYQQAWKSAPPQFQDETAFCSLVLEDPTVLGCNYSCYACTNECDKCWVFYEIQKGR